MSRWVDAAAPEASVPKQRVGFDLEGMAVSKVDAAHYGVRVAMERKPGVFSPAGASSGYRRGRFPRLARSCSAVSRATASGPGRT